MVTQTRTGMPASARIDLEEFVQNGYVIVRNIIPPDQLDSLRAGFEMQFEKQRQIEAARRKPDDPPANWWENSRKRRVLPEKTVDELSAHVIDFLLGAPQEISQMVMRAPRASLFIFNSLNNPLRETGPDPWHRDPNSAGVGPLEGLINDLVENRAPAQVQWNVPLYDDPTLWVVPGSHRRLNTPEEERQLREDPRQPLPGGTPVDLKAGDGVVYTNLLLHWGSFYTPRRLRRTFHFGYRSFGGPMWPYFPLATGTSNSPSTSRRQGDRASSSLRPGMPPSWRTLPPRCGLPSTRTPRPARLACRSSTRASKGASSR
jgi:ectoine hydroxylase-related dioxygenase (phytanoyl-CoA dioxygenase family)